ncbi:tetratricopeptide repeat protein [Mucilaginibacter sp. BJC16-A38]|uniref:tetratricopeptide repeat protein n=1 Tax=Mucilaginibacter phenanthrenivorans TaxID=1234842 RepID=UPI0021573FAB|nr:tetratricopeptide repeat protein [Mucilaginibacter phenanthrenivorans]MCR8558193.1 tetratricopeptide repeat protein [Mucilaginibacter phenanthrenivorans]
MKISVIISFLIISSLENASAQNSYIKLGQQALVDGDFKVAVAQLEKACLIDSTNSTALLMLGYSYYHSENYKKSIAAYTKEIAINPTDATAYYYRARAKGYLGKDNQLSAADKEKYLLGAIFDLTKAIAIDPDIANNKYYQVRGIAYREYGVFKLQAAVHPGDKVRGINALKASIIDLEKVLADNPSRTDISALIDLSKQKLDEAITHR